MANAPVAVTYAAEDEAVAQRVLRLLKGAGVPAAAAPLSPRQAAPSAARLVVLWSQHAEEVRGALRTALKGRAGVVIARLDTTRPPAAPGVVAVANLQHWRGRTDHRGWRTLAGALGAAPPAAPSRAQPAPAKARRSFGLVLGFLIAGAICAAAVATALMFG